MTLLGLRRRDVVVRFPSAAPRNAAPAQGRQPWRWGGGGAGGADRSPGKKHRSLRTRTRRDELMDQNWIKPRGRRQRSWKGGRGVDFGINEIKKQQGWQQTPVQVAGPRGVNSTDLTPPPSEQFCTVTTSGAPRGVRGSVEEQ